MARRRRRRASTIADAPAGFWIAFVIAAVAFGFVASIAGNRTETPRADAPRVAYASLPGAGTLPPEEQPRILDPLPDRAETPPQPPAPAEPRTVYVHGHKVPMRSDPRAGSPILDRLGSGQAVVTLETRPDWVRIRYKLTQREGWVQAKLLSDQAPHEAAEKEAKPPSIGLTLSVSAIAKLLIEQSIAQYPGPCACPYQSARNGSACGRRAAYVRPGGYAPLCFAKDITPEMVAEYRTSH